MVGLPFAGRLERHSNTNASSDSLSFVPLIGSCVLSALLILFGHGPGTSDAKVNLFGFQPVELIRCC